MPQENSVNHEKSAFLQYLITGIAFALILFGSLFLLQSDFGLEGFSREFRREPIVGSIFVALLLTISLAAIASLIMSVVWGIRWHRKKQNLNISPLENN